MAQFEAITGGRKRRPRFAGDVQARLKYLPQLYEAKADEKYQEAVLALRGQELEQTEELGREELKLGGERLSLSREQQELQKKQQKKANIISGAQVASTVYLGSQIADVYGGGEVIKAGVGGAGTKATAAELAAGETTLAEGGKIQPGLAENPYVQGAANVALSGTVGREVSKHETPRSLSQIPAGQRLNRRQEALVTGAGTGALIGGPIGAGVGAYAAYREETGGEGSGGGFGAEVASIPTDVLGVNEPGRLFRSAGEEIDEAVPKEISNVFNEVFDFFTGGTHYCTQVDKTVGLTDDDREILKEFLKYAKANHRDVVQYYLKKGPEVVRFIHEAHEDDTPQVFIDMNKTLVQPTLEFMRAGEPEKAYRHYADFGDKLFHDYTPHLVESWTMIYRKDEPIIEEGAISHG